MRILNLGAGVQSTTILRMMIAGEIERANHVIFADTGWEPASVYRHLGQLRQECEQAQIPLHVVSNGHIRKDLLADSGRFASMPLHVTNPDGSGGLGRRQCTSEYKLIPIRRKARELMEGAGEKTLTQIIGISLDEVHRTRMSDVKYITHEYPLIDKGMRRGDCLTWLARHGYSIPPRSACIGCPFHSDMEWRHIKSVSAEWSDAVEFDREIRRVPAGAQDGFRGQAYLHKSRQPLDQVDLSTAEDHGQLSLFGNECLGMCGV